MGEVKIIKNEQMPKNCSCVEIVFVNGKKIKVVKERKPGDNDSSGS